MYGVYSKPGGLRGSLDEWHGALGYNPNTFSTKGIVGALPISYGRLLFAQAIAHGLARAYGRPVVIPGVGGEFIAPHEWPTGGGTLVSATLVATTVATTAFPYSWDTKAATPLRATINPLMRLERPYGRKCPLSRMRPG
jgi:hypothetical protein